MTATYLVEVQLDDVSSLFDIGEDIADAVAGAGLAVMSVKPWARPTVTQAAPPTQQGYPIPPPLL